jgi:hypothetical protein
MGTLNDGTMLYPLDRALIDGPGRPLRDLLARPWFSRPWALQEAVLGAAPRFLCGTHSASFGEFGTAVLCASVVFEIDCPNTIPTRYALRNNRRKGHQNTLLSLLIETYWLFDCSDPRDQVYALLSMQNSLPDFQIDFSARIEDVYVSVAQALIRSTGSLEILGAVDSNDSPHLPGEAVLPSWGPVWRVFSWANPFAEIFPFQACKDFVTTRHRELAPNCPKVEGHIDYVHRVERPDHVKVLTEGNNNRAAAQAFLRAIPEEVYHGIWGTNCTLPKQFQALIVRTILTGHYTPYGGPPPPSIGPTEKGSGNC